MPLGQQASCCGCCRRASSQPVGSSQDAAGRRAGAGGHQRRPGTKECAAGRFREDLLYRLNTIEIQLPPLRERREDIPLLAAHFLARHARKHGRRAAGFTEAPWTPWSAYTWPGNVRELEHAVERALLMARGDSVTADDLVCPAARAAPGAGRELEGADDEETWTLEEAETPPHRARAGPYEGNACGAAQGAGPLAQRPLPAVQYYDIQGL